MIALAASGAAAAIATSMDDESRDASVDEARSMRIREGQRAHDPRTATELQERHDDEQAEQGAERRCRSLEHGERVGLPRPTQIIRGATDHDGGVERDRRPDRDRRADCHLAQQLEPQRQPGHRQRRYAGRDHEGERDAEPARAGAGTAAAPNAGTTTSTGKPSPAPSHAVKSRANSARPASIS